MKLSEFVGILENIAPPSLAEDFDEGRIGLMINRSDEVNKVAVSLDPTDFVFSEASRLGADLLITHHTLIFEPICHISRILSNTLKIALENDISLYVMHTNFDAAPGGVNDVLADSLGLLDIEVCGIGRRGIIEPCSIEQFSALVARRLGTHVEWVGKGTVEHVMVVGGSGFSKEYIDLAVEQDVDVLVSGELRHSSIRYAESAGVSLIDATHYATENPAMKSLCERLPAESVFLDHNPGTRVLL